MYVWRWEWRWLYIKGTYDNYSVVNKDLTGEDAIFVKGKIVDDFNTLDKSSIFPLNVSSTQEPQNKNRAKNEINELEHD